MESKYNLSERQEALLECLLTALPQILNHLLYDCSKDEEREEVLQVLECFYSGMYQAHLGIKEKGYPDGTENTDTD